MLQRRRVGAGALSLLAASCATQAACVHPHGVSLTQLYCLSPSKGPAPLAVTLSHTRQHSPMRGLSRCAERGHALNCGILQVSLTQGCVGLLLICAAQLTCA